VLLATFADSMNLSGLAVMLIIIAAYVVIGCFLEGIGMVLITVPVFLPLVMKFGYDPIWFSIIVVIVVELGLIHPPVGMNLFVIQAQVPDVKLTAIYRGIIPFLIAPFLLIALLLAFPEIALWLPKKLYG
jgi:TRAP-type C4-dicarboxylate transport system permease large subunit